MAKKRTNKMNKNSISFKIQDDEFDRLLEIIRDRQGEEIFLFVETDENNNATVLGVDDIDNNDVIVFTKEKNE